MKRLSLLLLFGIMMFAGFAQTDTLFTKARTKIPCKIIEVNETEFKYKTPDNLDGPVYVIAAAKIFKYSLANGKVLQVTADELLVENQHDPIMNRRSAIKIHPFSYVNNQISLAYEQVLKMGTNLDVEAGYINNGMVEGTASSLFVTSSGQYAPMTGMYVKPGVKFMVGQDFSLKGMKYAHPMKGRYILINAVVSYLNFSDVFWHEESVVGAQGQYTVNMTNKTGNVSAVAYGAMVNYGRQFILGNIITLEYYIGVGATAQSMSRQVESETVVSYTNNYYGSYYYTEDQKPQINNYHGFFRIPNIGLSYHFGFRLGFLLPEKSHAGKRVATPDNNPGTLQP